MVSCDHGIGGGDVLGLYVDEAYLFPVGKPDFCSVVCKPMCAKLTSLGQFPLLSFCHVGTVTIHSAVVLLLHSYCLVRCLFVFGLRAVTKAKKGESYSKTGIFSS